MTKKKVEEEVETITQSPELQSFLTTIKEGFDRFEKSSPNWLKDEKENPCDISWAGIVADHIFREISKYVPKDLKYLIYYGIQFCLIDGINKAKYPEQKEWTEEHIFNLCKELAETGEIKELGTRKQIEELCF